MSYCSIYSMLTSSWEKLWGKNQALSCHVHLGYRTENLHITMILLISISLWVAVKTQRWYWGIYTMISIWIPTHSIISNEISHFERWLGLFYFKKESWHCFSGTKLEEILQCFKAHAPITLGKNMSKRQRTVSPLFIYLIFMMIRTFLLVSNFLYFLPNVADNRVSFGKHTYRQVEVVYGVSWCRPKVDLFSYDFILKPRLFIHCSAPYTCPTLTPLVETLFFIAFPIYFI